MNLLSRYLTWRRTLKLFERLVVAHERQADYAGRLADHFAPVVPAVAEGDLRSSGPSYARDSWLVQIEDWHDAFVAKIGREPTDAEEAAFVDELTAGVR